MSEKTTRKQLRVCQWNNKKIKKPQLTTMIILSDNRNQMCNKLWAFSFFIAYGMKNDVEIYIPNFKEYESFFENLNQFQNIKFKLAENSRTEKTIKFGISSLYKLHKIKISPLFRLFNIYFPPENQINELFCDPKRIVIINSWKHKKDIDAFLNFKPQIKSLFKPKDEYCRRTNALFLKLKQQYDVVIGVHIRRGDYINFQKGIYFFDDTVYCNYMTILSNELAEKRVAFFISSIEAVNSENYGDLNIHMLENSLGIEDLYALSECDYIMGPPSTFSMWASFYGSVPLKLLENANEKFTTIDFSVINYQNNFVNGSEYSYSKE